MAPAGGIRAPPGSCSVVFLQCNYNIELVSKGAIWSGSTLFVQKLRIIMVDMLY